MTSASEAFPRPRQLLAVHVRRLAMTALALSIVACTFPSVSSPANAWVRLHNDSPFALEQIRYSSGSDPIEIVRLQPGAHSAYSYVSVAYGIAYVEALIEGRIYTTRAEDFSAYPRLASGEYTYRVSVDSTLRQLTVAVLQD